jgi:long-chain acyl-CoA synthetase
MTNEMTAGVEAMAQPWTALYPEGMSIGGGAAEDMLTLFRTAVALNPQGEALIYFDQASDYAELDRQSEAFGAWLNARGVGKGDRVIVLAQNIPSFSAAVVAAWKLGAVPIPLNPMYRASELAKIFADAAPSAVLCQPGDQDEVAEGLVRGGLKQVAIAVVSPHLGQSLNDTRVLPEAVPALRGDDFEAILRDYAGASLPHLDVGPDELGLILYTSGTTGVPKGVMLSHRSLAFNARFLESWCHIDQSSRILAIAPFFHITGLVCHLCVAISARCSMIMNYRFDTHVVADMIRRWQPSFTIGAITAFNALNQNKDLSAADLACLKSVFSGGAPIPPALKQEIQDRLGIVIHPSYGMTETAAPAIFAPFGLDVPVLDGALSIGIPIPGTHVRIMADDGSEAPFGVAGEICMRGPQVMEGYWNKAEETAEVLRDGWMHSGDVGMMDEKGWVYIVDRKKDVIIASGFKVWPREVEDVLYAHPAVREAAVIGVADTYRGETVKAVVSLKAGASATHEDLVAHCRENLAAYKTPRLIEFLDDLPKTVSGKIQRAALRV